MTEIQRYLAEEVAEDHADGIITRREAMRRLGLLGLGSAAASALLAVPASQAGAHGSHGPGRGSSHDHGAVEGGRPSPPRRSRSPARTARSWLPSRRPPIRWAACW
jgi:carboxymethylenebutenolidase